MTSTPPPYAPSGSGSFHVDTPSLRRLEPFLAETLEQFDEAARYASKVANQDGGHSGGGSDGPVSNPKVGLLEAVAAVNHQQFMQSAAALIPVCRGVAEELFAKIVTTRELYEATEDDNAAEVTPIFGTITPPARPPESGPTRPASPLPGAGPLVPDFDPVSDSLKDPTTQMAGRVVMPPVGAFDAAMTGSGQGLEALGPSGAHVAGRISDWVGSSEASRSATSARFFTCLAQAITNLGQRVTAILGYLQEVWSSGGMEAAANSFDRLLVLLEDTVGSIVTFAEYESATTDRLITAFEAIDSHATGLQSRWANFLECDRLVAGVNRFIFSTGGVNPVALAYYLSVLAVETATLSTLHMHFNKAYQEFCAAMEQTYHELHDLRESYRKYAANTPACVPMTLSYPEILPRY